MPYKGCVLDLDGTALDNKDVISAENIRAIELLREKGLFIAVATGRSHLMIKEYVWQLGVELPVIACNGGMIHDIDCSKPPIFAHCIEKARALELLNWRREHNYDALVYTTDKVYHPKGSKRIEKYLRYNTTCEPRFRIELTQIDEDNLESLASNVVKILFTECEKEREQTLHDTFNKDGKLYIVASLSGLLDVMGSGISKGITLTNWANEMNVAAKELIVFGDNYNDISMFQVAGMSIAMGNAEEEVKLEADYVTSGNDESGVAAAIMNYVLPRL